MALYYQIPIIYLVYSTMLCRGPWPSISKALKTYEFPKGSGITISPISNRANGED